MSEELLVRHCSPTLAGLKTGNMFNCPYESEEQLRKEIRSMNRRLRKKGLRILPLKLSERNALIYVYRPSKLKKDFSDELAGKLLQHHGYSGDHPERCIVHLIHRLHGSNDFPHEIGLFLGYPPEDVQGFMEQGSRRCKLTGCWKVYGDEERAQKLFAQYKKCTDVYVRKFSGGRPIERLTVAARSA